VAVRLHVFLTSALDGGVSLASRFVNTCAINNFVVTPQAWRNAPEAALFLRSRYAACFVSVLLTSKETGPYTYCTGAVWVQVPGRIVGRTFLSIVGTENRLVRRVDYVSSLFLSDVKEVLAFLRYHAA
jgi:hypothetical protein